MNYVNDFETFLNENLNEGKEKTWDKYTPEKIFNAFKRDNGKDADADDYNNWLSTYASSKKIEADLPSRLEADLKDMLKANGFTKIDAKGPAQKSNFDGSMDSLFKGLDPKIVQKFKDTPITYALPGGEKKTVQAETLLDFVMWNDDTPEEAAKLKAQQQVYDRLDALRKSNDLEPNMEWNIWFRKRYFHASKDPEFQKKQKEHEIMLNKRKINK